MRFKVILILSLMSIFVASAEAHYLWVVVDKQENGSEVANIYFEESAAPGGGEYLEHFLGTSETWVRTIDEPQPRLVETSAVEQEKKRWMQAKLEEATERSVDSYGKFGVYAYGDTNVLLHYYARTLKTHTHEGMHELGRAEQLALDLVPHDTGDELELTLLWQGEPVSDRMVFIRGPKGFRENIKTNDRGRLAITPADAGRYLFRSNIELQTPGEDNDEKYELVRHHITLVMNLPVGR